MREDNQKEITQFNTNEIVDPRIQTIPLEPVKKVMDEKLEAKDDLLQTYKDEIARLEKELVKSQKTYASVKSYIDFKESMSLHCPATNRNLTIIQCTNRFKMGLCKNCFIRKQFLKKLCAKDDFQTC